MDRRQVGGAVLAFAAMAATVAAQGKAMSAEKTYTGCLAKSDTGVFSLTHAADAMTKDAMSEHAMGKDTMGKETMGKDAMAKGTTAKDSMMKNSMAGDSMAMALELSSKRVDLSKHVGHKVSITGTDGEGMSGKATFTVKSLKMIAGSCS